MKELKSIFGVLVLLIGGLLLYYTMPVYWSNFKVNQMISERAIYFTNYPKPDDEIVSDVVQRAQEYSVALTPEQVTVIHPGADLSIDVAYSVHIDFPGYPFDLVFKDSTTNHNVMR